MKYFVIALACLFSACLAADMVSYAVCEAMYFKSKVFGTFNYDCIWHCVFDRQGRLIKGECKFDGNKIPHFDKEARIKLEQCQNENKNEPNCCTRLRAVKRCIYPLEI